KSLISFTVLPKLAKFGDLSNFQVSGGTDPDGNLLPTTVTGTVVAAQDSLAAAQNYELTITLASTSGVRINETWPLEVKSGQNNFEVTFPADKIALFAGEEFQMSQMVLSTVCGETRVTADMKNVSIKPAR